MVEGLGVLTLLAPVPASHPRLVVRGDGEGVHAVVDMVEVLGVLTLLVPVPASHPRPVVSGEEREQAGPLVHPCRADTDVCAGAGRLEELHGGPARDGGLQDGLGGGQQVALCLLGGLAVWDTNMWALQHCSMFAPRRVSGLNQYCSSTRRSASPTDTHCNYLCTAAGALPR